MTAYFKNLPEALVRHLAEAQTDIRIAVCWFTHRQIFDALLQQLRQGVVVQLILEYDTQNFRPNGLDFQAFIQAGGQLFGMKKEYLMHHKFVLIDQRVLMTGSFNWTCNTNAENLIRVENGPLLADFLAEFERLKQVCLPLVPPFREPKIFALFPLFEMTAHTLRSLRANISTGARTWLYPLGKAKEKAWEYCRQHRCMYFDHSEMMQTYWQRYGAWDTTGFQDCWTEFSSGLSPAKRAWARNFCIRLKTGDLVIAVTSNGAPAGLGVLQSDPFQDKNFPFRTARSVQWLFPEIPETIQLQTERPVRLTLYKGSAMKILQELWAGGS